MAAASLLLLTLAWLRGERLAPSRTDLPRLIITGVLLWVGGNGLIIWAERVANAGFAALVVSSTPIWVTLIELVFFRKWPSMKLIASLTLGFAGLGVLMFPSLRRGNPGDLASGLAMLGGAFNWGLGSIYQNRRPIRLSSTATAAWQSLAACIGFLMVSLLMRESLPAPTASAWMAWGFLVIFGSLAFASFVSALKLLPINITMTYAYVNPVLSLTLAWLLLGESITRWTVGGAALVIVGVVGIFRQRYPVVS
jgi:drug/metabolite transporter (DMT)-like permease